MKNLGTLYRFELKKILKNRMAKVMLAILFAIAVLEAVYRHFPLHMICERLVPNWMDG